MHLHVPCLTQSESRGGGECSEFIIRHRVPIETSKGYFVECGYRFILLVDTPVQLAALRLLTRKLLLLKIMDINAYQIAMDFSILGLFLCGNGRFHYYLFL